MAQKKGTTTKKNAAKSGNKAKAKKPFYKKVWFWLTTVGGTLALVGIGIALFFILRGPSFEKIAEEQTAKIEESGQKVIDTFDKDADNNKKGPEGLNDAYEKAEKSIDKLVDDGLNELDKVKDKKNVDEDDEEYSKASDKIQDLGDKQKDELTEIYEKDDDYEKFSLEDKQEAAEEAIEVVNDKTGGGELLADVTVSKTDEKGFNTIEITIDSINVDELKDEAKEISDEDGEEQSAEEILDDFFRQVMADIKRETKEQIEKPKIIIKSSNGDKLAEG